MRLLRVLTTLTVLATPIWSCTDLLWLNLGPSPLNLGILTPGQSVDLVFAGTATSYDGSNGGAVSVQATATGNARLSGFASTLQPGSGRPFTFKVTLTATGSGTQTGTITFTPYCGPFAGQPTTITFTYTVSSGSPSTFADTLNAGQVAEPISTATGELFVEQPTADLALGGPLALEFRRYYASYLGGNKVTSALGANWVHNFDQSLTISGSTVTATLFRGKSVKFTQSGSTYQLSSTEQRPYQLIAVTGGFQLLDPRVNLIYSFNTSGALTAIQDRNGNTLTVTRGANGPTQVSDGLGRSLTFTYTGTNLTRVADQSGRSVSFEQTAGNLSAWTDANGKRSSLAYTTAGGVTGLLTSVTRPAGNQPLVQTYDTQARVATQADSFAAAMTLTYNASGASYSQPGNPSLTDSHDAGFNLLSRADTSASARYTYDANNRPTKVTDRTGASESLTYDSASGLPATHTDKAGAKTTFKYATTTAGGLNFYDLTGVTYADGSSISYTYDTKGNLTASTDQAGQTTRYTYNSRGQRLTTTNPAGGVTTNAYANDGTLTSSQLPSGDTTSLAYDTAKRLTTITNADSTTKRLQYDARNNLASATDERTNTRTYSYDNNNHLASTTDALKSTRSASFDGNDRVVSLTDALGKVAPRIWDNAGKVKTSTDRSGVSVNFSYDTLNRVSSITDATGKGFTFTYDQEARPTSLTDALSRTTSITRDARGLVTSRKTPKNEQTTIGYDSLQRATNLTDALGRATTVQYDPRGLVLSASLPGGIAASYGYNELGRLTSVTDPNGNTAQSLYDKLGRLTNSTDALNRITAYQYDALQRLSGATLPGQGNTVQNNYDATGNLTKQTFSDGTGLNFTYDAENRLIGGSGLSLTRDANGRIVNSNGLTIGRDAAGRVTSVTYATGKRATYTYDNRGLLTQVSDWIGGNTTFTYDAAQQLTSIAYANGVQQTYTYDVNGRLITAVLSQGSTQISSIALTRDAIGRVTAASRTAANIPDVAAGVTSAQFDVAAQSFAATYDTLGRVTKDAVRSYTWDLASRLTSYTGADGAASFTYDANGQRISRTSGGTTQSYVLNYALPLPSVATVQSNGSDVRYYIWLPDGRLLESVEASGTRRFYHFDESGSTNFLTGDLGSVTDSYAIGPYGETVVQNGATQNPFTYQGAYGVMQESSTGLFYMRARYFDSGSARFLSTDPVEQTSPRALNPYQFAFSNPIEGNDSSGEDVEASTGTFNIALGLKWAPLKYTAPNGIGGCSDFGPGLCAPSREKDYEPDSNICGDSDSGSGCDEEDPERVSNSCDPDQPLVTAGGLYCKETFPTTEIDRPVTQPRGILELRLGEISLPPKPAVSTPPLILFHRCAPPAEPFSLSPITSRPRRRLRGFPSPVETSGQRCTAGRVDLRRTFAPVP